MTKKIDVLVCSHNEVQSIPDLLNSLKNQSIRKDDFRIIFIDNGSADGSKAIIDSYQDKLDILYILEPRLGKSFALNTGYKLATSEFVAQIDADCKAVPNWLENILRVIKEESPDAIGGPYYPYYNSSKPVWYKDQYNQHFRGDIRKRIDEGYLDGANTVWRRKIVLELGGYSEQLTITGTDVVGGEDTELVVRARHNYPDLKIIYDPSVVVYHLTKKKYLTVLSPLIRSFELGMRARRIFNEKRPLLGSLKLGISAIREFVKITTIVLKGTFFRDRSKYPYYQNYLLEVVAPAIYSFGCLLSELKLSIGRRKP